MVKVLNVIFPPESSEKAIAMGQAFGSLGKTHGTFDNVKCSRGLVNFSHLKICENASHGPSFGSVGNTSPY